MKGARLLLDTCAAIWLVNGDELTESAIAAITQAQETSSLIVSPITAWEVGMLVAKSRFTIAMSPEAWFDRLSALSGVETWPLTPAVLTRSCALPGSPPADPADRIMIATARELGATLMTRDRRILAYGEAGHVATMVC